MRPVTEPTNLHALAGLNARLQRAVEASEHVAPELRDTAASLNALVNETTFSAGRPAHADMSPVELIEVTVTIVEWAAQGIVGSMAVSMGRQQYRNLQRLFRRFQRSRRPTESQLRALVQAAVLEQYGVKLSGEPLGLTWNQDGWEIAHQHGQDRYRAWGAWTEPLTVNCERGDDSPGALKQMRSS